jgi:hypothetical protein
VETPLTGGSLGTSRTHQPREIYVEDPVGKSPRKAQSLSLRRHSRRAANLIINRAVIGETAFELSARDLQLQNDRPALIEADKMEAVLADVDADRADGG